MTDTNSEILAVLDSDWVLAITVIHRLMFLSLSTYAIKEHTKLPKHMVRTSQVTVT